jgi:hypothetical protein
MLCALFDKNTGGMESSRPQTHSAERLSQTDLDSTADQEPESDRPTESVVASSEHHVAPGKDPLPATAQEFAAAVLGRRNPTDHMNVHQRPGS